MISLKQSKDDEESFLKVDAVLEQYGLHADARIKTFYYNLVKVSRIINKRRELTNMDLDLLRYFLEKTQCKIDVVDTADYKVEGPPDVKKTKEVEEKIEDETRDGDDMFGLPESEF